MDVDGTIRGLLTLLGSYPATPGPWLVDSGGDSGPLIYALCRPEGVEASEPGEVVGVCRLDDPVYRLSGIADESDGALRSRGTLEGNGALIGAAPVLLAEVLRLRGVVDRLERGLWSRVPHGGNR